MSVLDDAIQLALAYSLDIGAIVYVYRARYPVPPLTISADLALAEAHADDDGYLVCDATGPDPIVRRVPPEGV